ncbi:hypothetical protein LSH36_356g01038 [Paralvinella palmiformis]|uniref:G-protein coupled receptors family 1 profile domain-containing protein n=1 Tax=Paralvinella palmiformis TaxID=53620 RepID=A0AAD9JEE8_9ANNE|nr:hypothetical protein LSH36_356g01038 [Paralvinella palmiformis]
MLPPLTGTELQWLRSWLGEHGTDGHTSSAGRMDGSTVTDGDVRIGANISFEDLASIINQSRVEDHWFEPMLESSVICAYVFVISVGLVSNSLVCFVVARVKSLRTVRNMFIVNLAVSDIVMCLFCMPLTLVKLVLKNWPLGEPLCRITPWMQAANVFASTITITVIALDRYHVILSPTGGTAGVIGGGPTAGSKRRFAGAVCLIAAIWIVASLIGVPLAVYNGTTETGYFVLVSFTMCIEKWPSAEARFAYAAVVMVLQFVVPISILAIVHWRISNFLKCRINSNPNTLSSVRSAVKETRRHRKNTSLLMAITIMYALCWFPLTLLNFLADFNYSLFMYRNFLLVYAAAHLIAMTSAIANPILYGWYNANFKRHFLQTVCFWRLDGHQAGSRDGARTAAVGGATGERCAFNVVHAKPISYKAIQTEVQPQMLTYTPRESPVMITEACQMTTGSGVWYPQNEAHDP